MNRKLFSVLTILILLGIGGAAAGQLHKTVRVGVDGKIHQVGMWGLRVQDALAASGLPVTEGDIITPPLEARIRAGETVTIRRAFWVVITADGQTQALWTTERNLPDLLETAGIDLGIDDQLFHNGLPIHLDQNLPQTSSHSLQVRRATEIVLNDQGQESRIRSTAPTLGDALAEAGIHFHSADRLTPPPNTLLTGQTISARIERSREVVIQTKDRQVETRVLASTVGEALAGARMPLQGLDYSIPAENDPIPEDGQIRIIAVHEEVILEQSPIPFGLQYQALPEADLDTTQVVQVGEYGITAQRIRVVYEDGQEVSRRVEEEWVAKNPQPRIVGYGTKITVQTAQTAAGPIEYWRKVDVYATSYSPCNIGIPGQCGATTASGKVPQKGMIAVIRSWYNRMQGLPVYVTSYGFATIEDIGAGVAGQDWIDLAFSDEEYSGWSGHVTLYFLTPVPGDVMWILE